MDLARLDFRTWPPRTRWLFGVLVTLGAGWVDFITGSELRVYPLYYLPLTIGSWQRGTLEAVGLAGLTALTWFASNWLGGLSYSADWIWAFNTGTQFAAFTVFASLTARLSLAVQEERRLAQTDPLTGLLNTRHFRAEVTAVLERVERHPEAFALVFLDLDNFKWVNDNLGHKAGDRLLTDVAATLQTACRKTDRAARLGGDEFALLLPDTDEGQARAMVDRLTGELRALFARQPEMPVSASVGVAVFNAPAANVDATLQRADELMYRAKNGGKDHAVFATF